MQKTVLKFGLIAGAILSVLMVATIPFIDAIGDHGEVIGYAGMLVAFMMVFFGIRSYRDHAPEGAISFMRAFQIGILITAIASVCYVATWEVMYYKFMPDFADKYEARAIEKQRASGASAATIAATQADMEKMKEIYANPFANAAVTSLEVFPIGLIVTLISAGILRRRRPA